MRLKCLVLFFFFVPSSSFAELPELKIAFVTDSTGPGSFFGVSSKLGVQLAEKDLRAEGNPVKVLYGEHSGKPQQAVSEIKKLLQLDKPDAIITEFSSATNAVVEIVRQSQTPFVGACGSTGFLSKNEFALKSSIEFDTGCLMLLRKFKETGREKMLIFAANSDFGERCIDGVHSEDKSIAVSRFNLGDDLRSEMTKVVHEGYDAIILAGLEDDAAQILRYIITFKAKISLGLNEGVFAAQALKDLLPQATEEVYGFNLKSIPKHLQETLLGKVDATNLQAANYGYLNLKQVAASLRKCKKGDLECFKTQMLLSKENSEYSFKGYQSDRIARFDISVQKHKDGRFVD